MKETTRRIAVLLLTAALLMSMCPVGLADDGAAADPPAEELTESPAEPPAEPTAEPVPEPTEAPAPEPTQAPETPEATQVPESPETPEATEVPEVTQTPEATEVPGPTEVPENPEATETPEPTESPAPSESPAPEGGGDGAAAEQMRELLAKLPTPDALRAMAREDQQAVYMQTQSTYELYMSLPETARALVPEAEGIFAALFELFNSGILTASIEPGVQVYDPRYGGQTGAVPAAVLTGSETTWTQDNGVDGWYYVKDSIAISQRITVSGSVNLILGNNATLTASQGIGVDGGSLTIWGQPQSTGEGYSVPGRLIAGPASSTYYESGIGGSSATVIVLGGEVTATGSYSAAGIGGNGDRGGSVTVEIYGGKVTATGGRFGAGIGTGSSIGSATVTIAGGVVSANGGYGAAGVGSAERNKSASVTITGGTVNANGGENSAGLGAGSDGSASVTITGGSVKSNVNVPATDGNEHNVYPVTVNAFSSGYVLVNDRQWDVINHGAAGEAGLLYLWLPGPRSVVDLDDGSGNSVDHTYVLDADSNTLVEGEGANYYDPDTKETKFTRATLLNEQQTLTGGWYVARGAMSVGVTDGTPLTVSGDVNVILTAGCELDAPNGINVTTGTLRIYGESGDMAKDGLMTTPSISISGDSGNVTVNGGNVTVGGSVSESGMTVNGGHVTVSGGNVTVGGSVSVYDTTVNGGNVTVGGSVGVYNMTVNDGHVTVSGDEISATNEVTIKCGVITANRFQINTEAGCIEISGGSVKVNEMSTTPINGSGLPVHLLVVANGGQVVTVNGTPWNSTGHSDGNLYMYLPGETAEVSIGGGAADTYTLDGDAFYTRLDTNYSDLSGQTKTVTARLVRSVDTTWTAGWYVVQGNVEMPGRVAASGDVNLILADGTALNATSGVSVTAGSSLTVWGQSGQSGKLTATGTADSAPIGSERYTDCGDIIINGGVIEAEAGEAYRVPGIGGFIGYYGGSITINSGVVTAHGGSDGAGIGGTVGVTINGGTVTAAGKDMAAGIGGTVWCTGSVVINGGDVTAEAGSAWGGAGIGGGDGNHGYVTINGGTVTAKGGRDGAGIGGGGNGSRVNATGGTGLVTINGGTVNATSKGWAAAIGGGNNGTGMVTITDGTVNATGKDMGAAIGGGRYGTGDVTITGGPR